MIKKTFLFIGTLIFSAILYAIVQGLLTIVSEVV